MHTHIALGSDHAGFRYKRKVAQYLEMRGIRVTDFGAYSEEASDYPDFIEPVARAVNEGRFDRGIVFGHSGNGEAIVANRFPKVRCCLCWNIESAKLARSHNDSNILSIGQNFVHTDELLNIVVVWLNTAFDGGRHSRRLEKLEKIDIARKGQP